MLKSLLARHGSLKHKSQPSSKHRREQERNPKSLDPTLKAILRQATPCKLEDLTTTE